MNTDLNSNSAINLLRAELLNAESVLNTQYSFDLAEPSYIKCLQLIAGVPEQRKQIVELILSMFISGELSDEPVAFLMHALRWTEILNWAQVQLQMLENPIANGRPLEKIIAAFNDDWENKIFYKTFSRSKIV